MKKIKNNAPNNEIPKIILSEVKQIAVTELKINPLNHHFPDNEEAFQTLLNDIKNRNITTPLVAKSDGTLLSGHRRLKAALLLGFKTVPVQFVISELSEEQEREYFFKDNIVRRQLNHKEKKEMIKSLYENEIFCCCYGGDRKSVEYKKSNIDRYLISLPQKIEREIGIPENTAKMLLVKIRKEEKAKEYPEQIKLFKKQIDKWKNFILNNGVDFKKQAIKELDILMKELKN